MRTLPTMAVIMPIRDDQFCNLCPSPSPGAAVADADAEALAVTAIVLAWMIFVAGNEEATTEVIIFDFSLRTRDLSHDRELVVRLPRSVG
jgi:hypothetical protein